MFCFFRKEDLSKFSPDTRKIIMKTIGQKYDFVKKMTRQKVQELFSVMMEIDVRILDIHVFSITLDLHIVSVSWCQFFYILLQKCFISYFYLKLTGVENENSEAELMIGLIAMVVTTMNSGLKELFPLSSYLGFNFNYIALYFHINIY